MTPTMTHTWTDLNVDIRLLILSRLQLPDAIALSQASPHQAHSTLVRKRIARLKPLRDAWVKATAPSLRCYANPPHLETPQARLALSPAHFSQLTALPLAGSDVSSLAGVEEMTNLKALDVSCNKLTTIPEELGECTQLRVVNLGRNKLTQFPQVVLKLPQLRTLLLHQNRLASLPDDWSALENLHRLGLFDCGLKGSLPEQLCTMLGTITDQKRRRSANLQMNRLDGGEVTALLRRFPLMASAIVI